MTPHLRLMHAVWLSFAIVVGGAASAHAQNAQITGAVKDQSGAVIPGATITARNVDTGLTRVAVTDGVGEYRLPSLPPGRYAISTQLSGFSTETSPDITLIIDQTAIINLSLKPAAPSGTVTRPGASASVRRTRADGATAAPTPAERY